ncbi:MAG: hypothetical protein U9N56_00705 [Actinomycetota bacterium]|nr:hypothetical protein [Actinomycetota bacterium]
MTDGATPATPGARVNKGEQDYRRNFSAGLVHAVFLQASTAFSSIHTVLPSFVATLTGSTFAVGLMASVQGIAHAVASLWSPSVR